MLSSKWSHPCACPLGVSQASLLEHLPPKDFDMTQLLLRNQQGKFKMAEGCFIPISQQHTSNSKALWDFGSYGNNKRDSLLFEKEVPAAQVRDKNSFVCNEFHVRKRKMIFPESIPLKFFLTWISFCHQWVFNKSHTDDFFNRRGCRGMTAAGGSSGTTSHASSIFSLFFSLVIPLIHSTLDCMTQLKL